MPSVIRTSSILAVWFLFGFLLANVFSLPIVPSIVGVGVASVFTSVIAELEDWFMRNQGNAASSRVAFVFKASAAVVVAILGLITFLMIPERPSFVGTWATRTGFLIGALSISGLFLSPAVSRPFSTF